MILGVRLSDVTIVERFLMVGLGQPQLLPLIHDHVLYPLGSGWHRRASSRIQPEGAPSPDVQHPYDCTR